MPPTAVKFGLVGVDSKAMSLSLTSPLETLVPPARLASLLIAARTTSGLELSDIELAGEGRFSMGDLRQIEAGAVTLSDNELRTIARIYNVDLGTVAPGRSTLEIDRSEGLLIVGGSTKRFLPDDDDRKIMLRYLALVYKMRDTKPGIPLGPRDNDLAVLAEVFGCSVIDVRDQFDHLTTTAIREIQSFHGSLGWRKILPGLGVLVAITAAGGLLLTQQHNSTPVRPATSVVGAHISIGEPLVITRDGSSGGSASDAESASAGRISIGDPITVTAQAGSAAHHAINVGDAITVTR
jgi:hypothetical protein